ncbi:hypothetical protein BGW39_003167, partial [Mortierella sp. 14UC]
MSHGDTNVGGETNPTGSRAVTFADIARSTIPLASPNSLLPDYPKKCDTIFHDESLPNGMNLHVSSNSHDSLIFSIPRKMSNDSSIRRTLMDTYDLTSCATEQHLHHYSFEVTAADPSSYSAMVEHGLTVNGKVYTPTIPSPPGFNIIKVNFRRIPQHYKWDDILKLFSSFGKPMHIGMYYHSHPNRKIYTQEGFVLFEVVDDLSHPELPREIKVGPGPPIILHTVGASSSTRPTTPNNNNKSSKAPPAKNIQQKDAEGFQLVERKKRNGKKRVKTNKTSARGMEGVESTSPAEPAIQANPAAQADPTTQIDSIAQVAPQIQTAPFTLEAAQVATPSSTYRVARIANFVAGRLFQGPAAGAYRQTRSTNDLSDSDSESDQTPTPPSQVTNRTATRNFHKYLTTQRIDILALQETSIQPHDTDTIRFLDNSLRSHHSIWTPHCALLLMHSKLTFLSSYVLLGGRAIVASIGSVDTEDKVLFEVCTIYAPSGAQTLRNTFYTNLLRLPFFQNPGDDIIVLGDFNYHHHMRNTAPVAWKDWINNTTINTLNPLNSLPIHTYNNHHHQSTIDYIFMSPDLAERVMAPSHTYLHNAWTDHTMLSCELRMEDLATGPGIWRLNTTILKDE